MAGEPINEQEALARLRQSDDPSMQYYGAWWLGRNRSQHPEAVPLLIAALKQRRPRDPGAGVEENAVARNAARALGKLAPAARAAVPELLAALDDADDGLREAGARQHHCPRLVEPCEALLEALGDIGAATPAVLAVIEPFIDHDWPLIRSAAARALLQLSGDPRWAEPLLALLGDSQLQVRRAALMDLGAAGWRPAAAAISATLAENSLKLIALRGLVENGRGEPGDEALLLTMDNLL
jgi:phycocyanobilin lyase alpha subunit